MPFFEHDGIRFHYRESGAGLPFVFQHGLGADSNQTFDLFRPPAGVVSAGICEESGNLAGAGCPKARTEWFISGTEPTVNCESHGVPTGIGAEIEGALNPI